MAQNAFKLRVSKNTRVIKSGGKALVYNSFSGTGIICHTDMLELINSIKTEKSIQDLKKQYPQPDVESKVFELMEKNLVIKNDFSEENKPYFLYGKKEIQSGSLINKLRLNVSQACNMRCSYCYVDQKSINTPDALMTWDTAKTAIAKFFSLLKQHRQFICIIRFFGGEPLLNWPVIKQSLSYIQKQNQEISVSFLLNTNGTIYTEEIGQALSEHNVGVAISLDGPQKEHDRFRKFKSGKPSYKVIVRHIENYLNAGCNIGIETTLGDHNSSRLKHMIDQIAVWNNTYKTNIPLSFQHLAFAGNTPIDTTSVKVKTKRIISLLDYAVKKNIRADTGMVHFSLNTLKGQKNIGRYCRAMGGELCVYPDGSIYPCGALKCKLGHIRDLRSVLKSTAYHELANRSTGTIAACKGCEIEAFCAGGCAADAIATHGTLNAPAANCSLEKAIFRQLVKEQILTER